MVHGILSKALSDALRWNRAHRNVAKAATRPSSKQVRNLARTTWTPDELHCFFDWLGDNRYRYPFAFTATSGCRRGEILGLRWADVDLDRATAMIANQITTDRQHGIVHKDMTKTHHSFVIHLDPATVGLLADWRARQDAEKEYLGGTYQDHGLVFCLEDGRPYHPDRFSREFETAAVVPTLTLLDAAELAITTINQLQKNLPQPADSSRRPTPPRAEFPSLRTLDTTPGIWRCSRRVSWAVRPR